MLPHCLIDDICLLVFENIYIVIIILLCLFIYVFFFLNLFLVFLFIFRSVGAMSSLQATSRAKIRSHILM